MREHFENWLRGNEAALTVYNEARCLTFMRLRKRAQLDCIYEQDAGKEKETEIFDKFKFAGIYDRRNGRVYAAQGWVETFCKNVEGVIAQSRDGVISNIEARVREIVDAAIDNNRDNLKIQSVAEITEPRSLSALERHIERGAAELARRMFLAGDMPEDIRVCCDYAARDISDTDFLDAIIDLEAYCQRTAAAYIENTQEDMFVDFLVNEATKAEMLALINDPAHEVHIIAAIKHALNRGGGIMVNVTTRINAQELTFKTTASDLSRDPWGTYSTLSITAQDRRNFEKLYGRHESYRPKDIVKITYGKAVLYEKNVG